MDTMDWAVLGMVLNAFAIGLIVGAHLGGWLTRRDFAALAAEEEQ
jgi:hypothetical protein